MIEDDGEPSFPARNCDAIRELDESESAIHPLSSGPVNVGNIELDEQGLLRLESQLESERKNGSVRIMNERDTLRIVVAGDAHFDSEITSNGDTTIYRVLIEVNGVLTVRRLWWFLADASDNGLDLIIRCDELKMNQSAHIHVRSYEPPRIHIQCKNNMVIGRPDGICLPVNVQAWGQEKGSFVDINVGGELIVEQMTESFLDSLPPIAQVIANPSTVIDFISG